MPMHHGYMHTCIEKKVIYGMRIIGITGQVKNDLTSHWKMNGKRLLKKCFNTLVTHPIFFQHISSCPGSNPDRDNCLTIHLFLKTYTRPGNRLPSPAG